MGKSMPRNVVKSKSALSGKQSERVIILVILLGKATKRCVSGKETAKEGLVKCTFIRSGQEGCVRVAGRCAQEIPEENP